MSKLPALENFMRLVHDVERVKRVAKRPDESEYTSTAEHTFELVMLCWYIIETNKLDLDHEKVLKYALAHDLVEGWAGDTYIGSSEQRATREAREAKAKQKMKAAYTEFPELLDMIEAYEQKNDPESRFVYAADKLVDPVNGGMEQNPTYWKNRDFPYTELRAYKDPKVALSPDIQAYWDEWCAKIETNLTFYFNE